MITSPKREREYPHVISFADYLLTSSSGEGFQFPRFLLEIQYCKGEMGQEVLRREFSGTGRELIREGTRGGLVGDVRVGSCSWTESWSFDSLKCKEGCQQNFHPGFPEVKLWPVWDDKVPKEGVLKGKGDQEGWKFSMSKILQVQEHPQKMRHWGKRPIWMNRET